MGSAQSQVSSWVFSAQTPSASLGKVRQVGPKTLIPLTEMGTDLATLVQSTERKVKESSLTWSQRWCPAVGVICLKLTQLESVLGCSQHSVSTSKPEAAVFRGT